MSVARAAALPKYKVLSYIDVSCNQQTEVLHDAKMDSYLRENFR